MSSPALGATRFQPGAVRTTPDAMVRFESLLLLPRVLLGVVGMPLLAISTRPRRPVEIAIAAVLLVLTSGYAWRGLIRESSAPTIDRLARTTLLLDTGTAALVLIALATSPLTPAAILLPLVVFEYALKLGRVGLGLAGLLLLAAVAVRAAERVQVFGLPPRYPLIMLIISASGLLGGLAMALRAEQRARLATVAERDRIRLAFRDAVEEALANAGVAGERVDNTDFDDLVQLACTQPGVGPEVGRRVAALLSPDPRLVGLTRREREIVELLGAGLSDREIAARLFVSAVTVRVHISNVMAKQGVGSRKELLRVLPRAPAAQAAPAEPTVGARAAPAAGSRELSHRASTMGG